jgi:DNA-binding winged helix-turn-helix (wHTH) protein
MAQKHPTSRDRFRVGDWEVCPNLDRLVRADDEVHLEPRVMDVLVFLAQHPDEVLPRMVILDAVWPDQFVTEAVLTRAIAVLRKALGDDARDPRYIETIPKRGYRLVARVDRPARRRASGRHPTRSSKENARFALVIDNQEFDLADGVCVIGRAVDTDIQICASNISRRHARISVRGGELTAEDLDSKNGTWLQGRRLTGPQRLSDGDRLVLGSVMVVVRDRALPPTQTDSGPDPLAVETDEELTPPEPTLR